MSRPDYGTHTEADAGRYERAYAEPGDGDLDTPLPSDLAEEERWEREDQWIKDQRGGYDPWK